MFGDGISIADLLPLFKAVREKNLTLQVKILSADWENISAGAINRMTLAVTSGKLTNVDDIRLRLFVGTKT